MHIEIHNHESPTPITEIDRIRNNPGFAVHATDHMISATWSDGEWTAAKLVPFANLSLDPRAMALHYGQSVFEGLKAIGRDDGEVALFRPDMNARRLQVSAERFAMPALPIGTFLEACELLVETEQDWIPTARGSSLYLRPILFATEPFLGVRPAKEYQLLVLASPAAPYFNASLQSITVGVLDEYTRASFGGTGAIKCAGNYAASYRAKQITHDEMGCDEVLWLDAATRTYVEELGGMNVMFVERNRDITRVITPRLDGTILPGITRASLLDLAPVLGFEVIERDIYLDELRARAGSGEITEAFACGTAAVVAPIERIRQRQADDIVFNGGAVGEITTRLFDELVAIQRGESAHFSEWRHVVEAARSRPLI